MSYRNRLERSAQGLYGQKIAVLLAITGNSNVPEGTSMRAQRIVWLPLFLVTISAGLLMPKSVHAQQDMNPTTFHINPGAPVETNEPMQMAELFTPGNPAETKAPNGMPARTDGSGFPVTDTAGMTPLDAIMVLSLIVCNGLIILLGIGLALRKGRRHIRGASAPYASAYRAL